MKLTPKRLQGILSAIFLLLIFILGKDNSSQIPKQTIPDNTVKSASSSAQITSSLTNFPQASQSSELVKVLRIVDGDTIVLSNGKKLRYIGIDTPEVNECFYNEAAIKNRELVEGKEVRLEKDRSEVDRYGRLLRYVWIGDNMINKILVEEGYANAVTYKPDIKYQSLLKTAETEALKGNKGLWSACR